MFPDLEFIKTALNAILCRFRNIQANVDDITEDIAVLKSDVASTEETIKASTADWNQNDESAVDYIKNKPFYEETTEETILGEYTGELSGLKPSSNLVYGDKYVIYLDGVRYDTECTEDSDTNNVLYVNTEHGWINIRDLCWEIQTNITGIHTLKVAHNKIDLYKIDSKFIDFPVTIVNGKTGSVNITASDIGAATTSQIANKMNMNNPVGTGSFSMGRQSGTIIGDYSHAEGQDTTASGIASHAEGQGTIASSECSHAEGFYTTASGNFSHAEGRGTKASGMNSHAQGTYNIEDTEGKYAHIVGNGTSELARSNVHTLDWSGNAWFAGDVFVGGSSQDDGVKLLKTGDAIPIPQTSSVGQTIKVKAVDKNGKPTEWEAMNIPEQVQPDWNEPDSASHAYIKNKPCYDYIEPSGVIWESDSAGTSDQGPIMLIDLVDRWLVEGETYRLTVDGVETTYTCASDADGDGLYIGAGFSTYNGGIFQYHTSTILHAYTNNLWNDGQKVRLEGPLRRYKKLDVSLYEAPAVDTTLTQPGQAADAAIVGNRLTSLSERMLAVDSTLTQPGQAADAAIVGNRLSSISSAVGEAEQHARVAEQHARVAQECAQAMAGTFDFTGYLRYQIVNAAPETYDEGVLYIVTTA